MLRSNVPPKPFGILIHTEQEEPIAYIVKELTEEQFSVAPMVDGCVHIRKKWHIVIAEPPSTSMTPYEYSTGFSASAVGNDVPCPLARILWNARGYGGGPAY